MSPSALSLLRSEPYWPKWDGPWWRMTLLWDLGRAEEIPKTWAQAMAASLRTNCRTFFLPSEDPEPETTDRRRQIMCHCGWGTIFQALEL